MKILKLKKISKFISWMFLFFTSAIALLFLLVSLKPVKINFINEIIDNQNILENYKINKIGDVYFSFNKFSKKFEILVDDIKSESFNIPNLLLGINIKNLLKGSFHPTILKVYDSDLSLNFQDYKNTIHELDMKLFESYFEKKDENLEKFLNNFEIIELSNSFLNIDFVNNKSINFGPIDLKIEKKESDYKLKGLIQKEKNEFLSFEFSKENFLNLKMNFENFKVEPPPEIIEEFKYFKFTQLILNGNTELKFSNDFVISNFSSNILFDCNFKIDDIDKENFVEGNFESSFNESILYTNLNLTDKVSKINTTYLFDTERKVSKKLNFNVDNISMQNLKEYWPNAINTPAVDWIKPNINGQLNNVRVSFSFLENSYFDIDKFSAKFDYFDVSVKYQEQMPKVENISGSAEFNEKNLNFYIDQGFSEKILLKNSVVTITDLNQSIEKIFIELNLESNSVDFLNYLSESPIDISNFERLKLIQGEPSINLKLDFPLLLDLSLEQINYFAQLNYINSTINNIYSNFIFNNSDISILVNKESIKYNGRGFLKNMKVKFEGEENLYEVKKKENIKVFIDLNPLLVNDLSNNFILNANGIIPLNINIIIDKLGNYIDISGQGDLSSFSGLLSKLDYEHNYSSGKIIFSSNINYNLNTHTSNFLINSENFKIDSEFIKNKNNEININLNKVVSPTQDFSAKIKKTDEKFDVVITGKKFNFENFFDNVEQGKNNLNLDFSVKIDELNYNNLSAYKPTFFGSMKRGYFENFLFEFIDNNEYHSIKIFNKNKKKMFQINSDNGETLLNFFDIDPNVKMGKLFVEAIEKNNAYNGKILLNSLVAYDAPFFAKVLTLFSLDGLEQNLKDGGVFFESLESNYIFENGTILLDNGLMRGSDLGLTFNGEINLHTNDFDVSGTLVPAYTINTLITSVPIIGDIITIGSPEEGILATTFNIKNFNDDVKIEFNPISVLVPSIIRNLIKLGDTN